MALGILRFTGELIAIALFAVVLVCGSLARADDDDEPSRLEVKHVGASGNVSVETGPTPRAAIRLVPFPEDEEEAATAVVKTPRESKPANESKPAALRPKAAKQAESKPVKLPPAKSTFQPKFKTPAVRQAQHVEPVDKKPAAEKISGEGVEGPELQGPAAGPAAAESPPASESAGTPLVKEAFAKSKRASEESDYTEIIDLCRRAVKAGLKKNYDEYARRLMGWAYNRRGEARAKAGNDKEALADFELAVELNVKSWRAVHNRAVSYATLGRVKEALIDFDQAIKLNSQYPNAYFNRGEMLCQQNDFAAAIRDYTAALKLGGPDAAIFNSRGHAFYRLRQFGDALADYDEAVKLDGNNVAALINRGDTHCDMGQYAEAAKDYRSAVQINPMMGRAYQSAAWLMATCPDEHYRNDRLAVDAANKAIKLDGENYRNLETLAAAHANAGAFDEAKSTQEKAIALAPKHELVAAEKRMALYQRELAFRERTRQALAAEEMQQHAPPVRRASADLSDDDDPRSVERPRKFPKAPTHPLGRN